MILGYGPYDITKPVTRGEAKKYLGVKIPKKCT
jgi:hypothetical protein